jgi:hypothetical protein
LFRSKQRTAAAWAKGLMLGKAVGARDEQTRIVALIENWQANQGKYATLTLTELIDLAIKRGRDD